VLFLAVVLLDRLLGDGFVGERTRLAVRPEEPPPFETDIELLLFCLM
jgi:hypothetical protein